MDELSGRGVRHALRDGLVRAGAAVAVLAGILALTLVFSQSPRWFLPQVLFLQYMAAMGLTPFGNAIFSPQGLTWLVVWSFLAGGVLDRYARNRPTRGRGFFAACGAHFPALLRLGIAEWLIWLAVARLDLPRRSNVVATLVLFAAGVLFLYARVRLVVEDRRSAAGALLASGRFIRRNPGAIGLFLLFAAALWSVTWAWAQLAPALSDPAPLSVIAAELLTALLLYLSFSSWAAATALFQARLAHASYTAAPPLEWPESPAAEAISNLSPSTTP
ncbi:MAG TPA: hypothetical protein VKH34_00535 [Vicinamibacterales bacterium]|nr:hypothetical protein [Vicinamibacterales bacterium]